MKRFRFPFERVRHWRRTQMEAEAAALDQLYAGLARLQQTRQQLETNRAAAEESTLRGSVAAQELSSLDEYRRYVRRSGEALRGQEDEFGKRIAAQREKLLEARRRLRLLDQLRERALREWQTEMDREIESLAADNYLGRWGGRLTRRGDS